MYRLKAIHRDPSLRRTLCSPSDSVSGIFVLLLSPLPAEKRLKVELAVRGDNTECTDTGCLRTVYRYGSKCTGIPEPTQGAELSLSLSLSLSLTRTHMHARAHTHTHAHTHAHTHIMHTLPPSPPPLPRLGRMFFPPSTYTSPRLPTFPQSLSIAPGSATRNPLNLA